MLLFMMNFKSAICDGHEGFSPCITWNALGWKSITLVTSSEFLSFKTDMLKECSILNVGLSFSRQEVLFKAIAKLSRTTRLAKAFKDFTSMKPIVIDLISERNNALEFID